MPFQRLLFVPPSQHTVGRHTIQRGTSRAPWSARCNGRVAGLMCGLRCLCTTATAKVDRRSLLQQITDAGARQRDHHELLASVQRQMFRSHCAWYVPIMLLLLGPSLVFMSPVDAASLAVARTLALPYVWGALSTLAGRTRSQLPHVLTWPARLRAPPCVVASPRTARSQCAASFAVLQWRRDKRLLTALAYAVLAAVVRGG